MGDLKLDFGVREMKPYIILDKEYDSDNPSYVTHIGMSSSRFSKNAVHRTDRLYTFYKDNSDYEIVFVKDAPFHGHFINLVKKLQHDKGNFEREYEKIVLDLNTINEILYQWK